MSYLHGLDIEHQKQLHVQKHVRVVAAGETLRQHAEQKSRNQIAEFIQLGTVEIIKDKVSVEYSRVPERQTVQTSSVESPAMRYLGLGSKVGGRVHDDVLHNEEADNVLK